MIRPIFVENSTSSARYHDNQVQELKERISERDDSLRQQLARLAEQPQLDVNAPLHLTGWTRNTQKGTPEFRLEKSQDGHDILYLAAKDNAICSWRTRTPLDEGTYRFEGRIRTKDVKPSSGEPDAGAGLRITGNKVATELSGTQDWQKFSYLFQVQEGNGQVGLVCELRASSGEAWFDVSSLRLVRLH